MSVRGVGGFTNEDIERAAEAIYLRSERRWANHECTRVRVWSEVDERDQREFRCTARAVLSVVGPATPTDNKERDVERLADTNRRLGGALLILNGVLDGNVTMERVDQEAQIVHEHYWSVRKELEARSVLADVDQERDTRT